MSEERLQLTDEEQRCLDRYQRLGHAIQTGIKILLEANATRDCEPKHLRVGINLSKVDHAAMVSLLIKKGIITQTEYFAALEEFALREAESYERQVQLVLGDKFTIVPQKEGL